MKATYLLVPVILVVGIGIGVGATQLFGSHTTASESSCTDPAQIGHTFSVTITNDKPDHDQISGKLCDSITFINADTETREIAFGPHEHHVPYDGIAEKELAKGQSFTIKLVQTGSYHWHDHIHDEVEGFFTVTK